MVWYSIVVLDDMALLNIALYCSEAERRVSGGVGGVGWVCRVIFMSNPTYIKLFWVVGCVVVLTISVYAIPIIKLTGVKCAVN